MNNNKKIRTVSNHNISEFDVLNFNFKKVLFLYILLIDNCDNSFYQKYSSEIAGLFIDIKDMFSVCLKDYEVLLACLQSQNEFNK